MSAPEPSGDMHAAGVVAALRQLTHDVAIECLGGRALAGTGAKMLEWAHGMDVVGLAEGLGSLPSHVRALARLRRHFAEGRYDVALLVDYPGFHLRVAATAAAAGVPVLYYVAPQVWAWGGWRMRSLRRNVRVLAVVLPFEEAYFKAAGIPTEFVGHPLLDRRNETSRAAARAGMGLDPACPVLAVFPGSRRQEIDRLWPTFSEAARRVAAAVVGLKVIVGARMRYPGFEDRGVWHEDTHTVLAAADVALCKSGTVTLEAAIHGTPMVIAYRMHPLTFAVARRLVRVHHVGLVNILAGRAVVPEFIQRAATPEALANAIIELLDSAGSAAERQRAALADIRGRLGSPGAGRRVAEMAMRLVA